MRELLTNAVDALSAHRRCEICRGDGARLSYFEPLGPRPLRPRGSAVAAVDDPHHLEIDTDETPELDEQVLPQPQRPAGG